MYLSHKTRRLGNPKLKDRVKDMTSFIELTTQKFSGM